MEIAAWINGKHTAYNAAYGNIVLSKVGGGYAAKVGNIIGKRLKIAGVACAWLISGYGYLHTCGIKSIVKVIFGFVRPFFNKKGAFLNTGKGSLFANGHYVGNGFFNSVAVGLIISHAEAV